MFPFSFFAGKESNCETVLLAVSWFDNQLTFCCRALPFGVFQVDISLDIINSANKLNSEICIPLFMTLTKRKLISSNNY